MRSNDPPRLTRQVADLLKAPAGPPQDFVANRASYPDIYALAGGLTHALTAQDNSDQPVCLYTEDKALTAAAILAAAAKDTPSLLLPYALKSAVLEDVRQTTGAFRVITDRAQDLPSGMRAVDFTPAASMPPEFTAAALDKVMLRIFTGGSTGKPQVWPKTLRNLFGEAFFMAANFDFSSEDRVVITTVPFHIYGLLFGVLVPLVAGACVAAGTPTFPREIAEAIARHRATVFAGVPSHYRVLREATLQSNHLRLAISSAGRLELADGAAFHRQTGLGVTEIYGSTETGGVASRNRANDETALTPLASVTVRIAGERLYVRSPYLSPNLATDAEGYYQTGDRVRGDAEAGFVLMGRADGIVKVGGKRVDLEGVQTCLKRLPGVRDALVLALPADRARENEIVAIVEGAVDTAAIRQALAATVEAYALPRRIRAVDTMPISAAGKYDRQAAADLFTRQPKADL